MSDVPAIYSELKDYAGREITFREMGQKAQQRLGARAVDQAMQVLIAGAADIRNDIVRGMRNSPATGKLYFRYYKFKRSKKGESKKTAVFHRASQAGFPPRPDTGDLIRSIIMDARIAEVEVGSIITNPAYPKWLEEGTKNMEARPWLFPAQAVNVPRIKAAMSMRLREIAEDMTR